jgi:RND family efflux transporter MFP subunit
MPTSNGVFAGLTLLFLGGGITACGDAHSSAGPPATPDVPVRVIEVQREILSRPVRAVGRLAQKRALSLGFKNGGTVRRLYVDEGAYVRKGQRLALIDTTEIDAQVLQARAAVEKADRDHARVDKLHASSAAAQSDVDNAHTAADVAHATLKAALYNQSATVLVAPEDGRIDKKLVEVGEQVGPGRAIYAMSGSAASVVARVGVVDRDLVGLRLGDAAEVMVDALPGAPVAATVSEIAMVPSVPSGTYEIELRLASRDVLLAAGMSVKVELARKTPPLPVVPLGALIDADGLSGAVYTLDKLPHGYTVRRVPIRIAHIVDSRVVVASGLSGAERVVSEGASFVEPGRPVQPVGAELARAESGATHAR